MSTGVDLSQFYDMFFDEADELLADMEQLLLGVDVEQPDIDDLNAIFRAAHSIKGGAGTFGCFEHLTTTTHVLENVLDSLRKGELELRKDMVDIFLEAKDVLTEQLAAYREGNQPDEDAYERICQQLRDLALDAGGASASSDVSSNDAAHAVEAPSEAAPETSAPGQTDAALEAPEPSAGSQPETPASIAADPIATATTSPDTAGQSAAADGEQVLRVALTRISPRDATALEEEMGIMGTVLHKEAKDDALTMWVETSASVDDIDAVCRFVVNANQLDVQLSSRSDFGASETALAQSSAPTAAAPSAATSPTSAAKPAPAPAPAPAAAPTPATAEPAAAPAQAEQTSSVASAVKPAVKAPAKAAKKAATSPVSSTLRVGVEKVDQIINLVGELVITQAMLVQTVQGMDPVLHDRLVNGVEQLERNARDLQEAVMSIRMMPMDYVFSRFPRVVRESASAMNKKIRLVTQGQATELDKSLIERIIDPLTHLVRNSIDHGIEKPEDRIKRGKDPEGVLTLSAQHSGGHIVIQVSDDGAGLPRDKILAKAMAQGFPVNENTPDDDLWQLIFAPGFSTAEQVTAISGRGVGMDVVRRNIQGMGGHIHLSSVAGKGTVTRIILPLTLAILDGMSVRVGDETFILPLGNVMESLQPESDQIRQISETEHVLQVRGEYLPIVALHDIFGVEGAEKDPTRAIAVILKAEEMRFALLVDHLVGQHQVVVKNLESNYRKIPGISAATILGDGSVALIVDVFALMRLTQPNAMIA